MNKVSQSNQKISFSISTNNSFYLNQSNESIYLYISLVGQELKTQHQNPPLNLSVVLDRSGSMAGDKLNYSKKAINFIIDNLKPQDFFSLIIYDDTIDILSPSQKFANKEHLKELVKKIEVDGCTNLSGGMLEGYTQVKKTYDTKCVNRVLLLSDGLANAGITDIKQLEKIARVKNLEEGMSLSTFGVGSDFDENIMTGIANEGNGNYYFIESPDKIPTIFQEELQGLLSVIAQNTNLEITLPKELVLEKLFGGYPYTTKDSTISLNFNDVFALEEKGVLLKLTVKENFTSKIDINTILTYDDAETFERKQIQQRIGVTPTSDQEILKSNENQEVLDKKILFESNAQTDLILENIEKGDYKKAKELIEESKQSFVNFDESNVSLRMQQSTLNELESLAEEEAPMKKEVMKSLKSTNYKLKRSKI